MSGGGGGTGAPRMLSRIHLPRTTGEVRSACDVTARMLPWPSSPRRATSVDRDAAEPAAVDVRNPVVPGQPLVDERVVGGHQLHDRAVFPHDALEEHLGFAPERLAEVVVEIREQVRVGLHVAHVAQLQPLAGEVVDERPRARVGQHAATCCLEHGGVLQLPCFRHAQQFIVWNAAPQEERQPRRQLDIADPERRAGRDGVRIALDAEDELRRREHALQRHFDTRLERPGPPCPRGRSSSPAAGRRGRQAHGRRGGPASRESARAQAASA